MYVRAYRPKRNIKIHIAVCEAFHGPRPSPSHMALHRDDIRANNREDNLYWGTREDNTQDMLTNGNKHKRGNGFDGPKNPNAKLTEEQRKEIVRLGLDKGLSGNQIAGMFNISNSAIHKILQDARREVLALIQGGNK